MEIDLNTNRVPQAGAVQVPARRSAVPAQGDNAAFPILQGLQAAMDTIPAVRPDVVARAQALVSSINYPPPQGVDSLAKLLALHLSKS